MYDLDDTSAEWPEEKTIDSRVTKASVQEK